MDTKALRQKILDLAIRGKLVPQDPNDEPASVLLERIREQKQQMVKEGKLKKKDIKNDSVIFVGEDNLHYEKFADGSVKCIEDEIPFDVPEGWSWARLQSVTTAIGDGLHGTPEYTEDSEYYFINGNNLYNGKITIKEDTKHVSEDTYNKHRKPLNDNTILLSINGTLGNVAFYNNEKVILGKSSCYINPLILDKNYLRIILESFYFQKYAIDNATGSTIRNLGLEAIRKFLVPISTNHEAMLIVAKSVELIEYTEKIQVEENSLHQYISYAKSKILDLAIRGQLVPQNPDDESASILLERIRAEKEELIKQGKIKRNKKESIIFKGDDNSYYEKIGKSVSKIDDEMPFTLPEGWEWCKLGSLCSSIRYGLSNSAESSGTHKLLRITDIQNGSVNWDTVPYTTTEDPETYILKSDDIVFARTGATVGKSFLIDQLPYKSVYASFLIRIRLLKFISPQYIYNFFNSPCYWEQISNKAVGVGQPNCNGTSLSNLFIPIPPAKVQEEIVSLITKLYEYIDAIEKSLS